MKGIIVAALAIALVLLTASTASAGYTYLSPVNPGSVAYTTFYAPAGTAYACPSYTVARPVVVASPVVVEPTPVVVHRPVMAVPRAVYYPAPVVVVPRVFVPGQPVRNVLRGVFP